MKINFKLLKALILFTFLVAGCKKDNPRIYSLSMEILPINSGSVEGAGEYFEGEVVTLTAIPSLDFHFVNWMLVGEELSSDSVFVYTMPAQNIAVKAIFASNEYMIALTLSPEHGGTVSGEGLYKTGSDVVISATPAEYFSFIKWTDLLGNTVSEDINYNFIMPSNNIDLVAVFEAQEGYAFDIDGNIYTTVVIGEQEWFTKNLIVTRYRDESPIVSGLSSSDWLNTTDGSYSIYPHSSIPNLNSNEEVIIAYGLLYNWYAVNNSSGICPVGWRVPTDEDWNNLVDFLVANHDLSNDNYDEIEGVGNALKSCRQVNSPLGGSCKTNLHPRWNYFEDDYPGGNLSQVGLDLFGFGALPSGYRNPLGYYAEVGESTRFWTSTIYGTAEAWSYGMAYVNKDITKISRDINSGYPVRCIKE